MQQYSNKFRCNGHVTDKIGLTMGIHWSHYLGFTYKLSDRARIYGNWSTAAYSGGYNLRNKSFNPADTVGPFDQEFGQQP